MSATRQSVNPDSLSLRDLVVWQDLERLSGTPCFFGTRVPIKSLFDYIEAGDTLNDFLDAFPGVTKEQALGALRLGEEQLLTESSAA
jgi:uncharacterized protein (DUF433 family)